MHLSHVRRILERMYERGSDQVGAVLAMADDLDRLDRDVDDPARIDLIRALEVLKAAAAAAQARASADLDVSQRAEQAAAGIPAAERGRGVAAQVALARRDSPNRGARHLGLAKALVGEMPCTLAALAAGRISEWRATILVRETAVLTRVDRKAVDQELAGGAGALDRLEQLGDRALTARAKEVAYRLDPHSVVARARRAEGERRVSVRPAPDTMAYLTALLPVRQAVAVQAALGRAAEAARCAGDQRGRGQLLADTLVASVTGVAGAAPVPAPGDIAVRLVMTDRTLLDGSREPARLDGYGPVPAGWARDLVASTLDAGARVFVTRLFTDRCGALVAMESRARLATAGLAALVRAREDGACRTSWCDAPVRHIDHVVPHAAGGATAAGDLQGLCIACNLTKEAPGWRAEVDDRSSPTAGEESLHTVTTTTPTGHTYRSVAPALPGCAPPSPAVAGATPASPPTSLRGDPEPAGAVEADLWRRLRSAA